MFKGLVANLLDTNNSQVRDLIASEGTMYTVTSQAAFRVWDLKTLQCTASSTSVNSSPTGIALIGGGSAIVSSSNSQLDFVYLSTLGRSLITTNAAATMYSFYGQQVAANPSTKRGIATKSTTGSVTLINGDTFTCSSLVPSGSVLTSQNATCVAVKDSNFLIGTTDNKVHELDTSGTVIKSVTLPSTPQVAALTNLRAGHLSYYNNLLLVSNTAGMIYLYDWSQSTPALLDRQYGASWDANQVQALTPSVSGITFTAPAAATTYDGLIVTALCPKGSSIGVVDTYCIPARGGNDFVSSTYDITTGRLVMSANNFPGMFVFDTYPPVQVNVPTRIQDPVTVDVPGRIIRIRDGGIGNTIVDLDTSIGAAQTNLVATNGSNYIEIALTTSPNKFDVRQFQA